MDYESPMTSTQNYREGPVAKAIEKHTAKLPSDIFLWTAVGTAVGALTFHLARRKHTGTFLGQLTPSLLLLGLYNKIVKVAGSDRADR